MEILLRVPVGYVGKIVALSPLLGPLGETRYLFATPHGSVFELGTAEMDELNYDDLEQLLAFETQAKNEEKVLYGGPVAISETIRILAKKAS